MPQASATATELALASPAFAHNGEIPSKYTCDGENASPPFELRGVPEEAQSLVLVMDDPDAPLGTWDHWVVYDIPPTTSRIEEGSEPPGTSGENSWERPGYGGPCPPSGEHRYFFKLYALDKTLSLPPGSSKRAVEEEMRGRILAETALVGRYERK